MAKGADLMERQAEAAVEVEGARPRVASRLARLRLRPKRHHAYGQTIPAAHLPVPVRQLFPSQPISHRERLLR